MMPFPLLLLVSFITSTVQASEVKPGFFLPPQTFYVHAQQPRDPSKRPSSYPYIAGDSFRALCKFIIDETNIPFEPAAVQDGDLIFVKPEPPIIEYFFAVLHPKIHAHYILITHNSDEPVPGNYARYLDDAKVLGWFGQNTDREHPKLFTVPIGIANQHWPHGNVQVLTDALANKPPVKNNLLYMNFDINTNPRARKPVYDFFVTKSFCFNAPRKPWPAYLQEMAHFKFVLSPVGNGLDCHKTWEAFYLGCIPVVQKTSLDPMYEGLPILIVDQWHQVTEELLKAQYAAFHGSAYSVEKCYMQYWIDLIRDYQEKCIKILRNK